MGINLISGGKYIIHIITYPKGFVNGKLDNFIDYFCKIMGNFDIFVVALPQWVCYNTGSEDYFGRSV